MSGITQLYKHYKIETINVSSGFTLVEVLVSVVILAIGILGTLALQARGLMDNQDAYLRTQAIMLSGDMRDRIIANQVGWQAVPANTEIDCITDAADCNPVAMAQFDYWRWQQDASNRLPQAQADVVLNGQLCNTGNIALGLRVQITWTRANRDTNNRLGNACFAIDVQV